MTRDEIVQLVKSFGEDGEKAIRDAERKFFTASDITTLLYNPESASEKQVLRAFRYYEDRCAIGKAEFDKKFARELARLTDLWDRQERADEYFHDR